MLNPLNHFCRKFAYIRLNFSPDCLLLLKVYRVIMQMMSICRSLWDIAVLMAVLWPSCSYAASVRTCSEISQLCTCVLKGAFQGLKCSTINEMDVFRRVVSNASERATVLEFEDLNLDYLPLNLPQMRSFRTLIVSNSTFNRLQDSSSSNPATRNIQHFSLENVGFVEKPQLSLFSSLNNLQDLFIYNSTVGNVVATNFSYYMSKHLESITIAQSNITGIERRSLREMKNLKHLRISHNKLRTFRRNILPEATVLEELRLDYNRIHSLPAGVFDRMPHLKLLSLSNNSLSTLPQEVFGPLWSPQVHLELRDNPIKCDNRILWTVTSESKPKEIVGQCAYPKALFGRNIKDLTERDLNC